MTLQELREQKRKLNYSDEMISDISGVSQKTVQLAMSGAIRYLDRKTRDALAQALKGEKRPVFL